MELPIIAVIAGIIFAVFLLWLIWRAVGNAIDWVIITFGMRKLQEVRERRKL